MKKVITLAAIALGVSFIAYGQLHQTENSQTTPTGAQIASTETSSTSEAIHLADAGEQPSPAMNENQAAPQNNAEQTTETQDNKAVADTEAQPAGMNSPDNDNKAGQPAMNASDDEGDKNNSSEQNDDDDDDDSDDDDQDNADNHSDMQQN